MEVGGEGPPGCGAGWSSRRWVGSLGPARGAREAGVGVSSPRDGEPPRAESGFSVAAGTGLI